jgi:hypothetical protein
MRCECCNVLLTDSEATAKFAEPDGRKATRYVSMCNKCKEFLPKEIRILTRADLEEDETDEDELDEEFENDDEEE